VSALADRGDDDQATLLALTTYSNQVSLIYSFAAEFDRAGTVLTNTLALLEPHSCASNELRLATASLHQNLARLALRVGGADAASEEIRKMVAMEGFGEEEIQGNFIAWCNAHNIARVGSDASFFTKYLNRCNSDFASTVKAESEVIFLMRQGRWDEAFSSTTRRVSHRWDCNVMWQLYAILSDWSQHAVTRFANELSCMIEEIELEEPQLKVDEISIARLMLRVCAFAGVYGHSLYEKALKVTQRIGERHGDYYMAQLGRGVHDWDFSDPFCIEAAYAQTLRFDAEKIARTSAAYEEELLRFKKRTKLGER